MEIAPGVYLVDGVRGGNVYLLADDVLVLVDTGMPGNAEHILRFIKGLGRNPEELASIVITHGHIDHMGSLAKLRALTGARAIAHSDEAILANEDKYALAPHLEGSRGVFVRLLVRFGLLKFSPVDLLVGDGEMLPYLGGLRVVHTPGHTRGSICLLIEERQVLFTGDTIINNENRLSRPLPFGSDRQVAEQSLLKLARLDFDICCFGHGPPLHQAHEKVKDLAMNYPSAPLYWRVARNWFRLISFWVRLWRRS